MACVAVRYTYACQALHDWNNSEQLRAEKGAMSEQQPIPFYKPPLRPQRLIPAGPGIIPAEGLPVAATQRQVESWREKSTELPTPGLADAGQGLANRAWRFFEKPALILDALPPVYRAVGAPQEALDDVELIGSLLLALPDLMASGLENNIPRVDWMFSRLLNAPGHPGLIEAIMEMVAALDVRGLSHPPAFDQEAAIDVLRRLHRDVVSLQQSWDTLIEAMFPVIIPQPESDNTAKLPTLPADALTSRPAPHAPGPLPAGLMIAPTASSRLSARPTPMVALGKRTPRLVILLVVALLVVTVLGLLLAQVKHAPALTPSNAALSVDQQTPTLTTSTLPTPTAPLPSPTPTPTPPPPRPTPTSPAQPTPASNICPKGAAFCVSTLQLQASCEKTSSVTFQLIGASRSASWQAFAAFSGAQVSISPSHGTLKQNQTVTLQVQIKPTRSNPSGTIMIFGPWGTTPISVTVQICD